MTEYENRIYERLKYHDREYPMSRFDLHYYTRMSDAVLRATICDMRMDGIRVCSTGRGYYIAENEQEYQEYRAKLVKRIDHIQQMIDAMDKGAEI